MLTSAEFFCVVHTDGQRGETALPQTHIKKGHEILADVSEAILGTGPHFRTTVAASVESIASHRGVAQ